ncbi:MAG: hypothetical protein GX600_10025 [Dehalococcoidia bacterium]|jgi:uncharacterized membrane protein YvlD (DUF360 family)|nr:hypothetical protein [Dehalococcoidia bacterium]
MPACDLTARQQEAEDDASVMSGRRGEQGIQVPHLERGRLLLRMLASFFIGAVSLVLVLELLPGLGSISSLLSALWVILSLSVLQVVLWPAFIRGTLWLLHRVSATFMFVVFPLFSLFLLTLLTMAGSYLSPYFQIAGLWAAFLIALLLTVVSMVIASVFSVDDETVLYHGTLRRLGLRAVKQADVGRPGLIFIEIDGLGEQVLRKAMARRKMPNLKRWLDGGSHRLLGWVSDLSSQTSAAQAGILHGNNTDIPAFRWYDKMQRRLIVSSSIRDVAELEKKISDGEGLMSNGGVARGGLLSGDASQVVMTASRAFDVTSADLSPYYLNPVGLVRTLWLMVWDGVLEKKAAWGQRLRNEQPRVDRGGAYFILRSLITVLIRDFTLFALRGDIYAGVPYAYVTLAGYDEVAHHSGVLSPDALTVLRKLDKEIGKLERITRYAPREYRFVVLSDHGQSQGAPFAARYGESLENLVARLVDSQERHYGVAGYETRHESAYHINAALGGSEAPASAVKRRMKQALTRNEQVRVGQGGSEDIVVLASGNLGLISFSFASHRLAVGEITGLFPALLPGLVQHPGIGLVVVRSDGKGSVAFGKRGIVYLDLETVEGENPLVDYGPHATSVLARAARFSNAPDILVVSTYWVETDEVAAFENQLGNHGGIGGEQSRPFILHPAELDPGAGPLVGAEQVHAIFKRWIEGLVRPEVSAQASQLP